MGVINMDSLCSDCGKVVNVNTMYELDFKNYIDLVCYDCYTKDKSFVIGKYRGGWSECEVKHGIKNK
jgi:NMD protein affecting ribosome stability and mRNA decay